ncbi:effector-associated constant component EACC1 [Nocardia rhamnosiphila]
MPEHQGQLTISTEGSADDLFELLEWLNDHDELRGLVKLPRQQIRPGEMGGLSEVLVVALGGGGVATALISSLTSWFTVRRSEISVTVKSGAGSEISLDAKRVMLPEVTASLQTLMEALDKEQ